jgi:ribA/ribD-fused uncharacterized protein
MATDTFSAEDQQALYFSRTDVDQTFSTYAAYPFNLDENVWPTAEHYYQAMKFTDPAYQEKIRLAATPAQARKLGRTRLKRIRSDWAKVKIAYMTRAIYTRCKTYPEQASLLSQSEVKLVENSQYDYFWGCGRDRRGNNHYGQVLMNIRDKLRQQSQQ